MKFESIKDHPCLVKNGELYVPVIVDYNLQPFPTKEQAQAYLDAIQTDMDAKLKRKLFQNDTDASLIYAPLRSFFFYRTISSYFHKSIFLQFPTSRDAR